MTTVIGAIICIVCVLILTWYSCKYLEQQQTDWKKNVLPITVSAVVSLVMIGLFAVFYSDRERIIEQKAFQEGIEQEWEWKIDTVWTRKKK